MSFQWVFNNAETISINNRALVGQTITRNQIVRATSRGPGVAKFTVTMPDGIPWTESASYIQALDTANRFTKQVVTINDPGYTNWIYAGPIQAGQSWTVICVELPEWTIFARNQVSWSGPFVFYEAPV